MDHFTSLHSLTHFTHSPSRGRRVGKAWRTEGLCDPAFFTRLSQKSQNFAIFYSKRVPSPAETEVQIQKTENRLFEAVSEFLGDNPPTCSEY